MSRVYIKVRLTMPKRWCDQCSKTFASRQSLFKHKKRCTGAGTGTDGEPSTPNRCIIKIEEEAEEEGDDELSPQPTVKFLPPTTTGLWKRFHTIYPEQNKEKNRNELVSILDNLLRLGGICREDYLRYNDTISGGDLFPGIVEYNLATGSGLYLQPYFR